MSNLQPSEIIDNKPLITQEQITLVFTEDQMMGMNSYLNQCHQEGKLNDSQYQFYVNQLWDQDVGLENNLRDLNLWNGFISYQQAQTQQIETNQQINNEQKTNLQQTINEINNKISNLQSQIPLLQKELMTLNTSQFENTKNRYEKYPDNLRLRDEVLPIQEKIDTLKSQILQHQSDIENLQQETLLWESQLRDLQP